MHADSHIDAVFIHTEMAMPMRLRARGRRSVGLAASNDAPDYFMRVLESGIGRPFWQEIREMDGPKSVLNQAPHEMAMPLRLRD